MRFNWRQLSPFWFLLFPVNKVALTLLRKLMIIFNFKAFLKAYQVNGAHATALLPEAWVAWLVFGITFFLFMRFTVDVIGQITECLNINCLSIKKKAT